MITAVSFVIACQFVSFGVFLIIGVGLIHADLRSRRLPNRLTAAAHLGVLIPLVAAAAVGGQWDRLGRAVLGGVVLAVCHLIPAVIDSRAMGMGDVKLSTSIGTGLGWLGWSNLLLGGLLAFASAALVGLVGALIRGGRLSATLPFGPFMILGAVLAAGAPVLTGVGGPTA